MYKKIKFKKLKFVPASHEDRNKPGVVKKVIFTSADIPSDVKIQMVNWARLGKGKCFAAHYHEDMDEIFIITGGKVKIKIDNHAEILNSGDAIYIPMNSVHRMDNTGIRTVNYIVIGLSRGKGGQTVIKS